MNLVLPVGHLSFSQIILWLSSKETYRKKYYPDVRPHYAQTIEMAFGNHITEEMEKNNPLYDFIPRYNTFEYPQNVKPAVNFEVEGVIVKAYIDQLQLPDICFREQKTGRTPWTQNKVNKHIQLDIYSMLLEEHFGTVQDDTELLWVPARKKIKSVTLCDGSVVEAESNEIEVVGPCEKYPLGYVIYPRTITAYERLAAKEMILRVAKEINEDYRAMKHFYN